MGAMTVLVVGRHVALPRGLHRTAYIMIIARRSVTLASLRIKMRHGRVDSCHGHDMVGIRPTQSAAPSIVSLLIARWSDRSCVCHDRGASEAAANELLRLRVSLADPQACETAIVLGVFSADLLDG
jgi:hypothetical protein